MSLIDVAAFRLLAQREHSASELKKKLLSKGFEVVDIDIVIAKCQNLELQSDVRYAESLCRLRIRQGYGPRRIIQDLKKAEINNLLINKIILSHADNWIEYARLVWVKKYKNIDFMDIIQRQKCIKFLIYRGFSIDTIQKSFGD